MAPTLGRSKSLYYLKTKISCTLRGQRSFLGRRKPSEPLTASESTPPQPPITPTLPPELWRLIFRYVTLISPDPLDVSRGVSFLNSRHCRMRDYRMSMCHKRNLCLVSHLWNAMAREYLYEFVWICRSRQAQALADTLMLRDTIDGDGRHIRRVLIETPPLERCSPSDVRIILDAATNLTVYSDYRSVRRARRLDPCEVGCSSEELLSALAHPSRNLRWLSWTNYDSDISFSLHMSPKLESTIAQLEYLELTVCSPYFPSIFSDILSVHQQASSYQDSHHPITLPSLRSLKVTLDNATFAMLAKWDLPQLTNLSVVSADFSYAGGTGFSDFFQVHGPKLTQLELGHSSSMIEEHYLTTPPNRPTIPLHEYCPNLREFICSADAEWNWMNPDWISPHILLPSHPSLELIGIKDIDKRLIDDAEVFASTSVNDDQQFFLLSTQLASLLNKSAFPNLRYIRDLSYGSDVMRRMSPQEHVSKFWTGILQRCKESQVWLEDYSGYNITARSLKRASMGLEV